MNNWKHFKVWRPLLGSVAGLCVSFGNGANAVAAPAPIAEKSAAAQAVWLDAYFAQTNPFIAASTLTVAPRSVVQASGVSIAPALPGGSAPAVAGTAVPAGAGVTSSGGSSVSYSTGSSMGLVFLTLGGASTGSASAVSAANPPPAVAPGSDEATAVTAAPSKRPKPPKPPKPPKASR